MAITYVRYDTPEPRILAAEPTFEMHHIIIFDPVSEIMPSITIADRIRLIEPELLDADVIILRVGLDFPPGAMKGPGSSAFLDDILQVIPQNTPLAILQSSVRQGLLQCPRLRWPIEGSPDLVELLDQSVHLLRSLEVQAVLAGCDAILSSNDVHYSLPSGIHVAGFIALEKLASDAIGAPRLAEWLFDEIRPGTVLLGDQVAALPILQALQVAAALVYHVRLPIRVLQEYPADVCGIDDATDDLLSQMGPHGNLLFFLGVYSSGRTSRIFRDRTPPGTHQIALISTLGEGSAESCEIFHSLRFKRSEVGGDGKCTHCSSRSLTTVSPRGYLCIPNREHEFVGISGPDLEAHREFWKMVDSADAVRLHCDDPAGRHQCVHLDTIKLRKDPIFESRVLKGLSELPKPDLVLIPESHSSDLLAALVIDKKLSDRAIVVSDSRSLPEEHRHAILNSTRVLLLDDVIITGKALSALRLMLYRIEKMEHRQFDIDVFVFLARPSRREDLRYLKAAYWHGENHLTFAFHVLLPDHRGHSCFMCEEVRLLEFYLLKLTAESRACALRRIGRLTGTVQTPFRRDDDGGVSEGSFMGPLRGSALFASTLSVACGVISTIRSSPASKSLHVDSRELLAKFFDPEILGGFLRSFNRDELFYAGHVEDVTRRLEDIAASEVSMALVEEIAWAGVQGKLPAHGVLALIDRMPRSEALEMLRELILLNQNCGIGVE